MTQGEEPPAREDARESPRTRLDTSVRIELSGTHVEGTTRNVSRTGLLLVSDEELTVDVEYVDGDHHVARRGRIVRVQRLSGDSLGIAIAFDTDA